MSRPSGPGVCQRQEGHVGKSRRDELPECSDPLMQTAFGAFLSVYLTTNDWSATAIGAVLSAGLLS